LTFGCKQESDSLKAKTFGDMKTLDRAITDLTVGVEPDPTISTIAREVWRDLLASSKRKNLLASQLGRALGAWWYVSWRRDDRLVVRRQQAVPAGSAFGIPTSSRPTLGSPTIICNGQSICTDSEPEDDDLKSDLAYVMAKIAKYLNWPQVVLHGSKRFEIAFRRHALHETDFYTWAFEVARGLRDQRPANVDWDGIAEELEDLGISQERAFESYVRVLLAHLLKWAYDPGHRRKSWKVTIENNRDELSGLLRRNPGLRQKVPSLLSTAYRKARREAAAETSLDEDDFPTICPWSYDTGVDDNFWPEAQ
jgi:Domain of unknown function DUF29